jgi:hypothetical protein
MYYYLVFGVLLAISLWTIGSYLAVMNLEEPAYTVLEKRDGYEIRSYEAYIIAKTEVTGSYQQALNQGFGRIADYIFGNNTAQTKIAMTAPVLENTSEKIAMTVPVNTSLEDTNTRTVSFVLPAKYTLDTLPTPNNTQVELEAVPAKTVAALRFNWYATAARVANKKAELEQLLTTDQLVVAGAVQVAQYNPPLSMPLTRRNEILIPITQ